MNKIVRAPICKPHGVAYCGCLTFTGAMKPFVMDHTAAPAFSDRERLAERMLAALEKSEQRKSARKPAAMDVAPGLTTDELLRLVIDLTPIPAKPAKRRAPVARDSSDDSTADLNKLYASLRGRTR